MASVSFKNVVKRYPNGFHAVKGINVEIKSGEVIVLIGPSGCGKTTTLRMLAGLEDITSGEVYIGDVLVNEIKPHLRGVGMMFQNYALFPHMNVFGNIAFGLKPRELSEDEIKRHVNEIAEIVGVTNLLEKMPNKLSGGQRQRVALCRALACRHKVILFDEPLSNLDAKLRVSMRAELLRLHKKFDSTFIYVTHDQEDAMAIADKIILIKDGDIIQTGTAEELYTNPKNAFVASFFGKPQMNFWTGQISSLNGDFFVSCGNVKLRLPNDKFSAIQDYVDKEVYVGVRPEHLCLTESDGEGILAAKVVHSIFSARERHLHIDTTNELKFVACVPAECSVKDGEQINIKVDTEKLCLFDNETKERIR